MSLLDSVWKALQALPQPVTGEQVLTTAMPILQAQQGNPRATGDFVLWFEANSDAVLQRLNS